MSVRLRRLCLATSFAVLALAVPASAANEGSIVVLKADPVASYAGGVSGRPATSPKVTGAKKVVTQSADARNYVDYLDGRQRAVLDRLPGKRPDVFSRYRVTLAGFAAKLTPAQVRAARKDPAVAHVFKNRFEQAQADAPGDPAAQQTLLDGTNGDSAAYLGLPAGLWSQTGTPGPDHAGEGVVVGVIDTGITPDHPSFAAQPGGANGPYLGLPFPPAPSTFNGTCGDSADGFANDPDFACNDKLIGAEYFDTAAKLGGLNEDEYESPRDTEGHGTHTASTAVGNFGVDPSINGNALGVNRISGIAPAAQLAVYKALWTDANGDNGGYTSDLVAAIDAATADGVDVISYSIGSTGTAVLTADSLAFLNASDAGVFVSVSAGNDGPAAGTIGDPAGVPWVTGVAAGTNGRTFGSTLTINGSTAFQGASAGTGVTTATPIVDAANIPAEGFTSAESELCLNGSLSAAAAGKIVLCKRGAPVRLETSGEIDRVGGVGEILYNDTQGDDLAAYPFIVPTIAVELDDGQAIKALVDAGGKTGTIAPGTAKTHPAKQLARFSSRGPSTASPDIAKPDLEAPGVDILGANTPIPIPGTAIEGTSFQVISGTSMAAPHVSGAAALLRQLHPAWTPAETKSALMMTASSGIQTETGDDATPFDAGSGEINPNNATKAGLVLDTSPSEYEDYLEGPDGLDLGGDVPAADLNLASIAKGDVLSAFTTSRRFTSTLNAAKTYTVSADVPGFDVELGGDVDLGVGVTDSGTIAVPPGRSRTVALTATLDDAPYDEYAYGAMTLTPVGGGQVLHLPISLRPVELSAPDFVNVETDTPSGTAPLSIDTGFEGSVFGYATGLAAPDAHPGQTISSDKDVSPNEPNAGNVFYDVTVPEGADLLRADIANASATSDLDLYLYRDANGDGQFTEDELYDASATGEANEATLDLAPDPGRYRFVVNGFATDNPSTYDFTTWLVADRSPNDLADEPSVAIADPVTATLGGTVTPQLSYRGLNAKDEYVGVVRYSRAAGAPAPEAVLDASVLTVTKTKDDAVVTPSPMPTVSPTVVPTPSPTPVPAKKLTARFSGTKLLHRRIVRTRVKLSRRAQVSARVTRKGKYVAKSRARTTKAGAHTIRLRLNKRLKDGTYRLKLRVVGGGQLVTKTYKLVVKKPR